MGTPWDRAARGYVEEWMPRFVPYHLDLIREVKLLTGQRVLVACAGPGAEVLAAAREVGETGHVRALDSSAEMAAICKEKVDAAGLKNVEVICGDAGDTEGGPWDAIICAFGLWQLRDRTAVLNAWRQSLSEAGKIGILTWGPVEEDDLFERVGRCLEHVEPGVASPNPKTFATREPMAEMFEQSELTMVRHTIVRHTLTFKTAEAFIDALKESCTWRRIWEDLGDARLAHVAARFYGLVGGPDATLTWNPPATLAIAGVPGSEIDIASRASVRVPAASTPAMQAVKLPSKSPSKS
ncbi:MAG: class I SAM-dependent methyltransferase [Polyangiaceae bacterium]